MQLEAQLQIRRLERRKDSRNRLLVGVGGSSTKLLLSLEDFYVVCIATILISGLFGVVMPWRGFSALFSSFPLHQHFGVLVGD